MQAEILACECDPAARMNGVGVTIEKGVPIPEARPPSMLSVARGMEVGDSIFIAGKTSKDIGWLTRKLKQEGVNNITRRVTGGVRVWRIENDGNDLSNGVAESGRENDEDPSSDQ